jgi:serine/threonine protein kinase
LGRATCRNKSPDGRRRIRSPTDFSVRHAPRRLRDPLAAWRGWNGRGVSGARHRLNRDVALKILPPQTAGGPLAHERFEREAQAVAALSHPNILAVHDLGRTDAVRLHADLFLVLRPAPNAAPQTIAVSGAWKRLLPRAATPP